MRVWTTLAIAGLCAITVPPALADSVCKVTPIAKFAVQMDGPRATVPVTINGTPTRLWLDSGAFFNFMPKARAVELGLPTEPAPAGFYISGIGGRASAEVATARDFGVVGVTMHKMQFVVGGTDVGNGVLGANFLGIWDTEFDLAKGAVNLFKTSGCNHTSLAYWAAGMAVSEARLLPPENPNDHHIFIEMAINGHTLRAMLDSGAPTTIVGSRGAQRAGIDLTSPKVVVSEHMGGIGAHMRKSRIARTQTIDIGGEQIRNSPIRVVDDAGDMTEDIILGADFLISHHLLVSQSQHKVYLTYNGGPIFSASTEAELGHQETRAENMGAAEKAADPKTADEFAGRGSARLTNGDATGAIADFSEAIRLKPGSAELLASRAKAYQSGGHAELALQDIDAALTITPTDHRLLTRRAQIRLNRGDTSGALADTNAAAAAVPKGSLDAVSVVLLYEMLGQANRGLALLDAVLALHHDDSAYLSLLNARNWNRGLANADLDSALKDADTVIRKGGQTPQFLDTRALVHLRHKDYAAAIADANAALAKQPKLASSLYFRGLAHIASGDAPSGKADIAAARAIQPKIDALFALYGLGAPSAVPAQPKPGGEDDSDQ